MHVFLDFEASSLSDDSFPVEVAWIFEDGRSRSSLLRPIAEWTDWSVEAERIHGLSRARLEAEGAPVDQIAREMVETLTGHRLYASAPSWDGKWLSVLLRGAGLPRHALRLGKSDDAFLDAARAALGDAVDITALVSRVITETEPAVPAHRALADATLELERWRRVKAAAQTERQ
jgi:hypothetical protein